MKPQRERTIALALLAAVFLLRLGFVMTLSRSPENVIGEPSFVDLAVSMLTRGEFSLSPGVPSWVAPPLFPLWIAGLYWALGQKVLVIFLANIILSAATGWLIYLLARRRFNPRTALIFLALWAVYPYSIYYCGSTFRETFFTFLTALMLSILDRWFERGGLRWACWGGVCGALIALTNPSGLLFVGAAPFGCWLVRRSSSVWRAAACFYLLVVLLYAPWVVRNQRAFGRPLLTNIHGVMNLYHGLRIPNDGLGTEVEGEFRRTDPVEVRASTLVLQGRFVEAESLYKAGSRRLILQNPAAYVWQCLTRVVKFWRPFPYRRNYSYSYAKVFWTSLLSDGILIPLGFVGLWLCRRRWKELLPVYLLTLFVPLAYYLTYVVIRFRMPVMLAVILAAASVIEGLLNGRIGAHD